MPEKDGWGAATSVPLKKGVSPQSNKDFGPKLDLGEATPTKLSHSSAKVSGASNPAKGSNDMAHAGTMAPLKDGDTVTANRPEGWPRGFQK